MRTKAQSTVEYILLVAAVTGVIILVTAGKNSLFQKRLSNTIDITTNGMQDLAKTLTNSVIRP